MNPRSVAVVSDIHGVLPVLEAVLAEPDVAAADLVVATGDLAAGPLPAQTLDRLVRGNSDRELVQAHSGQSSDHAETQWAAGQLRADQLALLAALPHPVTLDVAGFGPVLFCHGTGQRCRHGRGGTDGPW